MSALRGSAKTMTSAPFSMRAAASAWLGVVKMRRPKPPSVSVSTLARLSSARAPNSVSAERQQTSAKRPMKIAMVRMTDSDAGLRPRTEVRRMSLRHDYGHQNRNGRTNPAMPAKNKGRLARLLFPIHPLAWLLALLDVDRERRDRARFQAFDRDRLAGLLAEAVGALLDARERRVDLVDQLALAVARAQLNRPVGFRRGAVGQIRMIFALVLQVRERLAALAQDVFLPPQELHAEVLSLLLAHEGLGFARAILPRPRGVAVCPVLPFAVPVSAAGTVAFAVSTAAVTRKTPRHW